MKIKNKINENEKRVARTLEPEAGFKSENTTILVYNKLCENLIEISFVFASLLTEHERLCDCDTDSIVWKQMFVEWSNEFETIHAVTDWDQNDYLEEIETFAKHKILEYAGLEG